MPNSQPDHWTPDPATSRARCAIFGLLSELFRVEPSIELIGRLRSDEWRSLLADLDIEIPASFTDGSPSEVRERLSVEYTSLFIGPGVHLSPHESVHARTGSTRDGELWGELTVQVKRFIEATGLTYATASPGMPDHISTEFEFMARMAAAEAEMVERGDVENAVGCLAIQRRFYNEHLNRWIPEFCGKILDVDRSGFYNAVARLTLAYLRFDFGVIDGMLPPEPPRQREKPLRKKERAKRWRELRDESVEDVSQLAAE